MKKSSEQISFNMRRIKSKDTKIEILLRKKLWQLGYRYRKNVKEIFGKPDIVFSKYKIAVFCDSEFWHGINWETGKDRIKSNKIYWETKIQRNIDRDKKVNEYLENDGWIVIRLRGEMILKQTDECIEIIEKAIFVRRNTVSQNE